MNLEKQLRESVKMAKNGKRSKVSIPSDLPPGVFMTKEGKFVLPKQPAKRADILYEARELRLGLERRAEKLKALETELSQYFIDTLPVSEATGIAGHVARVEIKRNPVPIVENWDKFYAYVRKTGNFEMLHRRLNESSVKERWENKEKVPGVGVFNAKKVSCTKV